MNLQQRFWKMVLSFGLVLILAGAVWVPQPVWASMEDAAIFYDELKDYGEWVDYQDYGPVWYPTKVQENWRPYVDGRWSPAEEGYVFETQEPWGHATYHYGNWMPTPEYGWVWVPGRTWYPNTVTWRTSPESEGPDTSYIGWAPVPPPNYTPVQGYYPEGYTGGYPYRGPLENLITAPFWIFVKAASFLLGFSNPYTPAYSYWGSSALLPPMVVPYYVTRTILVNNYFVPAYYPAGYLVTGVGCYNWGPPIPYVARVTRISTVNITNYIQQVNIYQRANVVPPPAVLARRPYLRDVMPPAMLTRQPLPPVVRAPDLRMARANLVRPNLVNVNVIKQPPSIPAALPKAQLVGREPGQWGRGVPGAALPASAIIRDNRQIEERLRKMPPSRRLEPVSPTARKWNVPPTPGAGPAQPGPPLVDTKRPGPELTSATPGAPIVSLPSRTAPHRRGPQGTPPAMTLGQPGGPPEAIKLPTKTPAPVGRMPGSPPPSQAVVPQEQERFKPGPRYPGSWGKHEQTPQTIVTPGPYPRQKPMPSYTPSTPGTPPAPAAAPPAQVRPPRRPWAHQPQQPQQPQQQQQAPFQPQSQQQTPFQPRAQKPASFQPQPQMQMQRQPQPQLQPVQRQPQPQSFPQAQRQPQPRPQMQPPPRPQPQPQAQSQPQAPQKQHGKKPQQQNQ